MLRRFVYECKCGHEFDVFVPSKEPLPKRKRCPQCRKGWGTRVYKPIYSYPDMPEKSLVSLLPLEYTHATRGKVDRVEGNYALREHLKRYNDKYQTGLEPP